MAIKHSSMSYQEPMESNIKIATIWNIDGYLFSLICFMHYLYNYVFFLSLLKLYVNPIRAFTTALEEQ